MVRRTHPTEIVMARDVIKEIKDLKSRDEFANSHQFYLRLHSLEKLLESTDNNSGASDEVSQIHTYCSCSMY